MKERETKHQVHRTATSTATPISSIVFEAILRPCRYILGTTDKQRRGPDPTVHGTSTAVCCAAVVDWRRVRGEMVY